MLLGEDVSLAGQQPQRVALRKVVRVQRDAGMRPAVFRILLASRGDSSVVCRIGGAAEGDANYCSRSEGYEGYRKVSFVPDRSSPDPVGGRSGSDTEHEGGSRKVVASHRFDRRDDLDMGLYKPGDLRFHAKNLIFRASGLFSHRNHLRLPDGPALKDEQAELLLAVLDRIIDGDRYPLSPRVKALREIRALLKPYPERPPMPPPPRTYEPPSRGQYRRRRRSLIAARR